MWRNGKLCKNPFERGATGVASVPCFATSSEKMQMCHMEIDCSYLIRMPRTNIYRSTQNLVRKCHIRLSRVFHLIGPTEPTLTFIIIIVNAINHVGPATQRTIARRKTDSNNNKHISSDGGGNSNSQKV